MRYRLLGKTGVRISELCLGTMTFGEDWGFGASESVSRSMFDAFCEAGGNFIDTANTYTNGTSEKLVGKCIASDREYFVVSTKYSLSTTPRDSNSGGNHRKNMARCVEASLRSLRTDYIDLYWVHVWDGVTSIDEIVYGLDALVRSGKVRYVGISDAPAWIVARANTLSELRGWAPFVALQAEYNLLERTAERELLPMAKYFGISVLAWAPLGGGILSGKYVVHDNTVEINDSKRGVWLNADRLGPESLRITSELSEVAANLAIPPAKVALAWILRQSHHLIPIVCGRTLEQLEQNLDALNCHLDEASLQRLSDASTVDLGFPTRFLSSAPLKNALFGERRESFDDGTISYQIAPN